MSQTHIHTHKHPACRTCMVAYLLKFRRPFSASHLIEAWIPFPPLSPPLVIFSVITAVQLKH